MAQNESFDIDGPAGRLEALLNWPTDSPAAGAVICHAHPLHGGLMHFRLLFRVAKALQASGLAVLRFNFRGVGRSEGAHDEGRGEQDDAIAALDALQARVPDGTPLVVGGFSFGSVVATRVAARDPRPSALLVLGFPLLRLASTEFVGAVRVARLFVQGDRDEFCGIDALRTLVEPLPPPRTLEVIDDADHFFTDRLDALQGVVTGWVDGRPWL